MSSSLSVSSRDSSLEAASSSPAKRKRTDPESDSESSGDSDSETEAPGTTNDPPVLSHAERRRREKKKAKDDKPEETGGSSVKKRKLKDGTAAITASSSSGKRQNSVWVGNMTFKTTAEDLRRFFEGVGEVTRIHMPTKAPSGPGLKPENRGFAYVDFATPEAKLAGIAKSEQPLLGRKLLIKDGDDFVRKGGPEGGASNAAENSTTHSTHSKTAQRILRAQKQPPAPTLFIGNLPFDATDASIRELLEQHREVPKMKGKEKKADEEEGEKKNDKEQWIRKVRMGTFEDSGLCKGFAFVDFTSIEHATSALINPRNHNLHGRRLVFEYASAEAVRRGAPKEKRAEGHSSAAGGNTKKQRPFPADGKRNRSESRPHPDSSRHQHAKADAPIIEWQEDGVDAAVAGLEICKGKSERDDKPRQKGPRSRPKPGAALALAKRESAAIIPSQGQKIVF
ncbi:hypothetical protein BDQ17DRAFT_1239236 [Cyathus striatus]|nr:hypothetical protein BDQ17DRAFT_1239236 [Cyathus striatus]